MSYITTADIKDSVLLETIYSTLLAAKITDSDNEIADLAERKGAINITLNSPAHYKVKRYLVAWVCAELCKDLIGKNKIEIIESDLYYQKWKVYKSEAQDLEGEITREMLVGVIDDIRERPGSRTGTLMIGG